MGIDETQLSKANFLKGNIIINGLLLGGNNGKKKIKNKLYMHGKFVSFNTFNQPSPIRVKTIAKLFDSRWDADQEALIGFDTLFAWKCKLDIGSDGTRCKGISQHEAQTQGKSDAFLVDKAFGLIDMEFDNELFR